MESSYHNRDFERFLRQNADQYRMFPSERVWKNIHHNLHQRNRWYGYALALLLLTTATVTGVMLIPSNRNIQLADRLPEVSTRIPIPAATLPATSADSEPLIAPLRKERTTENENLYSASQNLFVADNNPIYSGGTEPAQVAEEVAATAEQLAPRAIAFIRNSVAPVVSIPEPEFIAIITRPAPLLAVKKKPQAAPVTAQPEITEEIQVETVSTVSDDTQPPVTAGVTEAEEKETQPAAEPAELKQKAAEFPMTIESVVNSYTRKKNKFTLQAYFTPTVSYRRLNEDNQFLSETQARTTPSNTMVAISDVENIVTHKPDLGLQLGVNAGYTLSPRLTFVTGLQFNVNKYDIRAYNYPAERGTIALMSSPYNTSVERETTYRNYSGGRAADWLHNLYFSASLPVGLQYRLSGAGKNEIGVAGTLQATYLLGNKNYMLNTDYKNYIEV